MTQTTPEKRASLSNEIRNAINRVSAENGSDTPDFILADYLVACLEAFDAALRKRENGTGEKVSP